MAGPMMRNGRDTSDKEAEEEVNGMHAAKGAKGEVNVEGCDSNCNDQGQETWAPAASRPGWRRCMENHTPRLVSLLKWPAANPKGQRGFRAPAGPANHRPPVPDAHR